MNLPPQPGIKAADAQRPRLHIRLWRRWCELPQWGKWAIAGTGALVLLGMHVRIIALRHRAERNIARALCLSDDQQENLIYTTQQRAELFAKNLRRAAEQHIAHALQLSAEDDATLLAAVLSPDDSMSWAKNPEVKHEVTGALISEILRRGLLLQVIDKLDELIPAAELPASPAWARRMLEIARCLTMAGRWDKAKAYLTTLHRPLSAKFVDSDELLRTHIELAGIAHLPVAARIAELESLAPAVAAASPALRSELHVFMGKLYGSSGRADEAAGHYRAALESLPATPDATTPDSAICYGVALFETGQNDAARAWLEAAVNNAAYASAASTDLRVDALRYLASIYMEMQPAQPHRALTYLSRAEGEAIGRIPADSSFWFFLQEQRAWILLSMSSEAEALAEFRRVLAAIPDANSPMRAQPLEGEARCCLALGQTDEALAAAAAAVALRERALADDTAGLGMAHLLHAQACDAAGDVSGAAGAYQRAAAMLPDNSEAACSAMLGYAYSLTQMQRWADAIPVWEAVIPRIPARDTERKTGAESSLAHCRKQLTAASAPRKSTDSSSKSSNKSNQRNTRSRSGARRGSR